MNRNVASRLILASIAALLLSGESLAAQEQGRGVPEGREHGCGSVAEVEDSLGCRDLLIEIANAYLESISTPGVDYLPELPDLLAPDAKRWINRNRNYQPPNNDGRDSLLLGVIAEPECVFENIRWIVEGNTQAGEAIAEFDAICVGFERPVPTVVRDAFVIEDGKIKEIRVIFTLVGPNP